MQNDRGYREESQGTSDRSAKLGLPRDSEVIGASSAGRVANASRLKVAKRSVERHETALRRRLVFLSPVGTKQKAATSAKIKKKAGQYSHTRMTRAPPIRRGLLLVTELHTYTNLAACLLFFTPLPISRRFIFLQQREPLLSLSRVNYQIAGAHARLSVPKSFRKHIRDSQARRGSQTRQANGAHFRIQTPQCRKGGRPG